MSDSIYSSIVKVGPSPNGRLQSHALNWTGGFKILTELFSSDFKSTSPVQLYSINIDSILHNIMHPLV